jgi:hypothetical protein
MICKICNAEFETKAKLYNHRRKEHQSKCIVFGKEVMKTVNGFPCPECAKFFNTAKNLQEHAKTHKSPATVDAIPEEPNDNVDVSNVTISTADLFCSLPLMELELKFNLKYSLLICTCCNLGLKICQKYLQSHFTNKSHAKKKVWKKN